jgi:hypothetical protein
MLDWDADHEVRIFRLASLPVGALDQFINVLAQREQPRWPVWVPSRWNLPSEEGRGEVDREVQRLFRSAKPAELIVAWTGYGERILAARRIPAAELANVPDWFSGNDSSDGHDWFSLLGLEALKRFR